MGIAKKQFTLAPYRAVTATDAQNNVTTRNFVLVAADPVQLDQKFKAIWGGLNDALVAGDKVTALSYLSIQAKAKFGPVFDALQPFMSEIVSSYSELARSNISNGVGEYAVRRANGDAVQIYIIYFLQDFDGVWRIDEM